MTDDNFESLFNGRWMFENFANDTFSPRYYLKLICLSSYLQNIHHKSELIVSIFQSNFETIFIPIFGNIHKKRVNSRRQCTPGPISPTRKVIFFSLIRKEKKTTGLDLGCKESATIH